MQRSKAKLHLSGKRDYRSIDVECLFSNILKNLYYWFVN